MKLTSAIGKGLKSLVNPRKWLGWDSIVSSTKQLKDLASDVLIPGEEKREETFEEAVQRLHLTEEKLAQQARNFFILSIIYTVGALAVLAYTIFLLIHGYWRASAIGIVLTVLVCLFAYRESLHYVQIKMRKLACTFKDWIQFLTRGVK